VGGVLMWVWIAVVVIALVVLVAVAMKVLGRLHGLERAARRLQHRQQEALALQSNADQLQETILGLQERAERAQEAVAGIPAARSRL
jgi:ABC-type multidrug transport system fused ATPase/permease subunit